MAGEYSEKHIFADPDATTRDIIVLAGGERLLELLGSEEAVLKDLGIDPESFHDPYTPEAEGSL